jgi:hypothetical protein
MWPIFEAVVAAGKHLRAPSESALAVWKDLEFAIVGTLPRAFRPATRGLVDACVLDRRLDDGGPATGPNGRETIDPKRQRAFHGP